MGEWLGSAMNSEIGPWRIYRYGCETRRGSSRQAAMTIADLAWPNGLVGIEHEISGERWSRRAARWVLTREAAPLHTVEPEATE